MGTISVSSGLQFHAEGDRNIRDGVLSLSTSYAAGGDSYTQRQFAFSTVDSLDLHVGSTGSAGFSFSHDKANLKILAYRGANLTLIATTSTGMGFVIINPTNLTLGTTAAAAITVQAAGLAEVTAGTDLSNIPVRFVVRGW